MRSKQPIHWFEKRVAELLNPVTDTEVYVTGDRGTRNKDNDLLFDIGDPHKQFCGFQVECKYRDIRNIMISLEDWNHLSDQATENMRIPILAFANRKAPNGLVVMDIHDFIFLLTELQSAWKRLK